MRTAGRILEDFTPAIGAGNGCLVSGVVAAVAVFVPVVIVLIAVVAGGGHCEPPCFSHCRGQSTLRPLRGRTVARQSPLRPHGTILCRPDSGSRSWLPSWPASPCCWQNRRAENRNRRCPGEARSSRPRPHRYRRGRTEIHDRSPTPEAGARESGHDFWVIDRVLPCLRCGLGWIASPRCILPE